MNESGLICIALRISQVESICASFPVSGQGDVLCPHFHQIVNFFHIDM